VPDGFASGEKATWHVWVVRCVESGCGRIGGIYLGFGLSAIPAGAEYQKCEDEKPIEDQGGDEQRLVLRMVDVEQPCREANGVDQDGEAEAKQQRTDFQLAFAGAVAKNDQVPDDFEELEDGSVLRCGCSGYMGWPLP